MPARPQKWHCVLSSPPCKLPARCSFCFLSFPLYSRGFVFVLAKHCRIYLSFILIYVDMGAFSHAHYHRSQLGFGGVTSAFLGPPMSLAPVRTTGGRTSRVQLATKAIRFNGLGHSNFFHKNTALFGPKKVNGFVVWNVREPGLGPWGRIMPSGVECC